MNLLNTSRFGPALLCSAVVAALLVAAPVRAQNAPESDQAGQTTFTGTIASSSRDTLVVRGENNRYQLFVFDRDTVKPRTLAVGSRVSVVSTPGEEAGVRLASNITVVQAAPAGGQGAGAATPAAVPPEVREVERNIERQVRRYAVGVRAGVALDPELILVGVQARIGPFFSSNVYFRPNVDFGWGEVSSLFSLNPDIIYRLPISARTGRWSTYVGGGPGFNFVHQSFKTTTNSGNRIDFGDFHSDVGLNIFGGLQYRSGMFMELRTSVYAQPSPTLRLLIGYNF